MYIIHNNAMCTECMTSTRCQCYVRPPLSLYRRIDILTKDEDDDHDVYKLKRVFPNVCVRAYVRASNPNIRLTFIAYQFGSIIR